ncbi:glycosyltransferase family 2 protein [Patiriisocius sp. Uisw_017]|uniref:glycosyltransferase family 2 protein n=1 Tax=Patiriisocius sp. Uisw_017 TaxID=3230968 RepID=UPI0039EAAD5D
MKLSVVILNYNVRYFLEQCIRTCLRATQGLDAEIIIVDNNSQDGSSEMVLEKFPHLQLIQNTQNVGFSKANNQAVAVAKGEYVCILNPDTAVLENVFKDLLKYAESLDNLGALGVYLMDGTGNFLPESKRNLPTPNVSLLKLIGFNKQYYASKINKNSEGPVSILVGAFMLMKRSVYNKVGGFDESYFMYGEDIDLSYKIELAGYQNHYFGGVTTLHYKGESTIKDAMYLRRFYGAMKIFYNTHFKTNFFFNFAVNLGVSLASLKSKFLSAKEKDFIVNDAFVLTENFKLFGQISKVMDLDLKASSKNILQDSLFEDTLFIFDAEYMSYTQIFEIMSRLKNRGNLYRIRPTGCNFILGSDESDHKGTVTVF